MVNYGHPRLYLPPAAMPPPLLLQVIQHSRSHHISPLKPSLLVICLEHIYLSINPSFLCHALQAVGQSNVHRVYRIISQHLVIAAVGASDPDCATAGYEGRVMGAAAAAGGAAASPVEIMQGALQALYAFSI